MKKSRWSKITEKYKFYSFLSNACLRGNLSQRSRLIWFSDWHYGIITLRMWAEYYDINDNKGLDWYFHEHWCTGPDKIQYFPTMKILDDTKFWCRRPKILIVLHIEKILQNQKNVTHRVKKKTALYVASDPNSKYQKHPLLSSHIREALNAELSGALIIWNVF